MLVLGPMLEPLVKHPVHTGTRFLLRLADQWCSAQGVDCINACYGGTGAHCQSNSS